MILAIDMGNSNIKIGMVDLKSGEIFEERVTTNYQKSSLEYADDIYAVMRFHDIAKETIEGAIFSSVVPPLSGVMETAIRKAIGKSPVAVSSKLRMDISLKKFRFPRGVGADLLVGAEALALSYKLPAILINMGTATTITVVDEERTFLGGTLLPGMKGSASSLWNSTAILPEIAFGRPGRIISRDTEECMRSGIIYGMAGAIDACIDRMQSELGECTLVSTGGMARFAIPYCTHKIEINDLLLMKGLSHLYDLNYRSCGK